MSRYSLLFCIILILATNIFYYPRWKETRTEATLSWDVSGYYMYLPAIFIYKDIKQCKFKDHILKKYYPTPDFQQAFIHKESGNYVMKYSIGQAILFSPFFAIAHLWASYDQRYPADGFSFPYQFMISMGSLLIAIIGLIFLRKALLLYFKDTIVGLCLLGIVIGTNYLNYAAIDGAMTHNSLFTIYSILIYLTILFYRKPSYKLSIGIGACVGMAALIRPTEALSCLIPILWGMDLSEKGCISRRFSYLKDKWRQFFTAIVVMLMIGSIQFIYWKYASGDWIVYSYQDQGFSWLSPHFIDAIFSYRSGWLIYTPFMVFALVGFIPLYRKKKQLFYCLGIFFLLFMYIAFSWDIWWYGGSLGQRSMVQGYPILAFPLCAFIAAIRRSSHLTKVIVGIIAALFIYANLWFTHQAHRGGLLYVSQMKGPYFWETLFTYGKDPQDVKLLDGVRYIYEGKEKNVKTIYRDTTYKVTLDKGKQYSEPVIISSDKLPSSYDWIRFSIRVTIDKKEWNHWRMTQFIVKLKNGKEKVSEDMIRIHRLLSVYDSKRIFLDLKNPHIPFTTIKIQFWNAHSSKKIILEDLKVETFDER